jgi:hypothetical protein
MDLFRQPAALQQFAAGAALFEGGCALTSGCPVVAINRELQMTN